ncbi:MAG TPA: hypothetical protein VN622_09005 [Clostridia bacterium]|nr:hypothetical protein [Clostridia bacterium]
MIASNPALYFAAHGVMLVTEQAGRCAACGTAHNVFVNTLGVTRCLGCSSVAATAMRELAR